MEAQQWWKRNPDANVVIVTGERSGLVVVDIDPRHGGDVMWQGVEEEHDIPDTLTARTPGGGWHLYFRHPGHRVKGLVGVLEGVDIRGDGSVVLAPPSNNFSFRNGSWVPTEYEWDDYAHEIAPMPPIIDKLIEDYESRGGGDATRKQVDFQTVLDSDAARVRQGYRNQMMAAIAGHFAGRGKSEDEVMVLCVGLNTQKFQPPLEREEVARVVASIMRMENEKRKGREHAEQLLDDVAESVEQHTPEEMLFDAAGLWDPVGVTEVTDWLVLIGDEIEYVLVTPENEVSLGDDLLNQAEVRRQLLNHLKVLMPMGKDERESWPKRALALRKTAREKIVESSTAAERLEEWVEEFVKWSPPKEWEPDERRRALDSGPILYHGKSGEPRLVLRVQTFLHYVQMLEGPRTVERRDLRKLMLRAGWTDAHVSVADGGTVRAMRQPDEDPEAAE